MKLAIEDPRRLSIFQNEISFAKDIFSDADPQDEPFLFLVERELMEEPLSDGRRRAVGRKISTSVTPEEQNLLKLENRLTAAEYTYWKKLPAAKKERMLEKVYASEYGREFLGKLRECHEARTAPSSVIGRPLPAFFSAEGKAGAGAAGGSVSLKNAVSAGGSVSLKDAVSAGGRTVKKAADVIRQASNADRAFMHGQAPEQDTKRITGKIKSTLQKSVAVVVQMVCHPVLLLAAAVVTILVAVLVPLLVALIGSQEVVAQNPGVMPYYAQADYWATPFNGKGKTIKSSGCGICSMAMVSSLLCNKSISPVELAQMANADASYNTASSHGAIPKFARYYELGEVEEMAGPDKNCCKNQAYNLEYIKEKIASDCPVIVNVTGGVYNPNGGGHYMALYGCGTNGVFVYDPASRSKYKASLSNDGSSWEDVFSHAKHIWIFPAYAPPLYNVSDQVNENAVYQQLKGAGFSDAACAGIIGNMYQECAHGASDLNPGAEAADGSIGLLQWTRGRKDQLITLAANRNSSWKDISIQLEYLLQELNSGSQWTWAAYASYHYPATDNIMLEEYKNLTDPELAAEIFCAKFVRPNYEKANLPYRKLAAKNFYNKVTQK